MVRRTELQKILEEVMGNDHVYFQPPSSVKMKYPAIVYELNDIRNDPANNRPYLNKPGYSITVIDSSPDSDIVEKVSKIPSVGFNRHYTADHLHHFVFSLYF